MDSLVAVVEIEGTTGVIILAVFVLVFLVVGALAWIIVRNTTVSSSTSTSTWKLSSNLSVSRPTSFEKIGTAVEAAASRPSLTREQREFIGGLPRLRRNIATGYRWGLIIAGIAGIVLSIAIYRDYRDDEMILLPVGIIFLLSVGVLLSGLVPNRTVDPIEPVDPSLLENIHIDVRHQPLTIQLDDTSTKRAMELLRTGMSAAEVARHIVPAFERLDDAERREVERVIAMLRAR